VQLREEDLFRLREQAWAEKLGFDPVVEFRGTRYLRQREDGACVFLMENGLCRIHAEFGFEQKPIACQLFPFSLTPADAGAVMGINFACQSVLENKGAALASHVQDLERMAKSLPEVKPFAQPPMLTDRLRASVREAQAITGWIDKWLRRGDVNLQTRLDGLAWVIGSLSVATLANVRDRRFSDLLDTLFGALPDELEHLPVRAPSNRQLKLLRQAAFSRVEDPKIARVAKSGRLRTSIAQLVRSRRFASGRGAAPAIGFGWAEEIDLARVDDVQPAQDSEQVAMIDDLISRWLRATVLGGRAWGAGHYGWSIVDGLRAMMLNVAVVSWLARLHAAGRVGLAPGSAGGSKEKMPNAQVNPRPEAAADGTITIDDVRAAISRVDRASGRAKWLGARPEKWRLRYLTMDDGLRRLIKSHALIDAKDWSAG
jgi:lysine-N-methylase